MTRTIRKNIDMLSSELSDTEKAVQEAFRTGRDLDVMTYDDRSVRGSVLRFLLLGGVKADEGHRPALRLHGARITGKLVLAYAEVIVPISLQNCGFDAEPDLYGATLSQVSVRRCSFPGLMADNATFTLSLRLSDCRFSG